MRGGRETDTPKRPRAVVFKRSRKTRAHNKKCAKRMGDPCNGTQSQATSLPAAPAIKTALLTAVTVIGLTYYTVFTGLFFYLAPRFERLRLRSASVTVVAYVGLVSVVVSTSMSYAVGWARYPCWLTVVSTAIVVPCLGCAFVSRLVQLFYRTDLVRLAAVVRVSHRVAAADGSSSSEMAKQRVAESGGEATTVVFDQLKRYSRVALVGSAFAHIVLGREDADAVRSMRAARFMLSTEGMLFVLGILLAPAVGLVVVLFSVDPIYAAGCTACVPALAVVLVAAFEGGLVNAIALPLVWRLRQVRSADDAWGFMTEVKVLIAFALLSIVFYVAGSFSSYSWISSEAFDFGIPLNVCMWILFHTAVGHHVFLAYFIDEARFGAQRTHDVHAISVAAVLANPLLAPKFEDWCKKEFTLDNVWFLADTLAWKESFFSVSKESRRARAKKLIANYVKPNSLNQVNLPHDMVRDILAKAARNECELELFDESRREVASLLQRGSLFRFVQSPEGRALIKRSTIELSASPVSM